MTFDVEFVVTVKSVEQLERGCRVALLSDEGRVWIMVLSDEKFVAGDRHVVTIGSARPIAMLVEGRE
jgi:hypothetical protein